MDGGIKDKLEKYAGAFCIGYATGKGAAYGWKAGMSQNNGSHSPYNNHFRPVIQY